MPLDPLYISAGSLRHSVTIQAPTSTRDAYGQVSTTWSAVHTTRASVRESAQREVLQSDELSSQVTHMVTIRYPGSSIRIVSGYRVVTATKLFTIQAVSNVLERNRVVNLQCISIDEAI
jgi:SPP1 family predicted phage head-tail adaptor